MEEKRKRIFNGIILLLAWWIQDLNLKIDLNAEDAWCADIFNEKTLKIDETKNNLTLV